ncbi:restriction endonuclease subunit S, partial [Ruminococcus bicirculans (ex Wegman et al. 2014)]|uniref:restriction endonuclease subunit S n=2 Tax=Ruminococcus TaxID=1263 RepID=UPI003FD868B7
MNEETKKRIAAINSGIIPEGYKKTKVGIVPVEWEDTHFSELFIEKKNVTSDFEKYPLYSLTIEEGVVPKSERYERSHLVKKDDIFKIVSENDFVYNPMNVRFGALARYKGQEDVSVSGYYDIFSVKESVSKEYMENFLLSEPMINYYNRVSTGSLKEKQRVHFSQFLDFVLPIPPLPEQQKIAEILSTQDKLIELQEKKIEQLKELKKAYLQKMFPKKGSKYPELRFKGFTDPWEQRKL